MTAQLDTKTILLVENNPDDEALIMRAFKRNKVDCKIVSTHSGVEAWSYLSKIDLKPDLIILDLKLPQMPGFEVLRRIRSTEQTKLLPVVILSSSREAKDIKNSYALGANSYIQKAIDLHEFDNAVGMLIDYWFCVNEPVPGI
jgi:DNA-binding response OmpR family regulator